MKNALLASLCLGVASSLLVLSPVSAATAYYADVLVDYTPVDGSPIDPNDVLGAEDLVAAEFGNPDNITPGSVTVEFSEISIIDGEGDDVLLHLIDWVPSENEIFEVLGSLDGLSFTSLGLSGTPTGGNVTDAPVSVGFDLAGTGLDSINFVKILNGRIDISARFEGVDIDAIQALNISAVPVPAAVWLFGSGILGLVGIAKRKKIA